MCSCMLRNELANNIPIAEAAAKSIVYTVCPKAIAAAPMCPETESYPKALIIPTVASPERWCQKAVLVHMKAWSMYLRHACDESMCAIEIRPKSEWAGRYALAPRPK